MKSQEETTAKLREYLTEYMNTDNPKLHSKAAALTWVLDLTEQELLTIWEEIERNRDNGSNKSTHESYRKI